MKKLPFIKLWDVIIILVIVLIGTALAVFGRGEDSALSARVTVGGEEVCVFDLSEQSEHNVEVGNCIIGLRPGAIRFVSSACPDGLCVKCGWLDKDGDTAVCLPEKTVIELRGAHGDNGYDAVAY